MDGYWGSEVVGEVHVYGKGMCMHMHAYLRGQVNAGAGRGMCMHSYWGKQGAGVGHVHA